MSNAVVTMQISLYVYYLKGKKEKKLLYMCRFLNLLILDIISNQIVKSLSEQPLV